MKEFTRIPANKISISGRKIIYGVAINDAEYMIKQIVNGREVVCKSYKRWSHMIERCYSSKLHKRFSTYKDCTVCDEWLSFSNFKVWDDENYIEGFELDKDLKVVGNKIYSPETCLFVSPSINKFMIARSRRGNTCRVGVTVRGDEYRARATVNGKRIHLGYFKTEDEAFNEYKIFTNNNIAMVMKDNPEIAKYLEQHLYKINGQAKTLNL